MTTALKNGQIDNELVAHYLDYSSGLWIKRLSTEFIMNYVTYIELMNEKVSKVALKQDTEFANIHQSIIKFSKTFDMNRSYEDSLRELLGFRKYLTKSMKVLSGYGDYARLLEYILNRLESDGYDQPLEDEAFVGEVLSYIYSEKDNSLINDKVKEIYGQLPIRVSKHKLFNMIELSVDCIKGISINRMRDYVQYLKEAFCPEETTGFGQALTMTHQELVLLAEDLEHPLETEEIIKKQQTLNVVANHLNDEVSLYLMTTGLINLMIGLILSGKSSNFELEKEHMEQVKTLLNHVSARADESKVIDDLVYHLLVKFEGIIEPTATELAKLEGINEQLIPLTQHAFLERLNELNQCYLLTSGSYFGELESADTSEICDNRQTALFKQELIEFIKSVFEKDTKIFQRARIAALLRTMNIVQTTPQEIYEFMMMNFSNCKHPVEKNQSQKMISVLMNDVY